MTKRTYPDEIEKRYPLAIAAMGMTKDEVEQQTDIVFYDNDGVIYSESHDERTAFRFNPPSEWEEVAWPLEFE